jgi:arginine decarboxylase
VGMPLVVDEAHGSHFGLHPGLPPSAMQQGADVAVQSTHKTLAALGQASMMHCQGSVFDRQRLAQCLRMLQVETALPPPEGAGSRSRGRYPRG